MILQVFTLSVLFLHVLLSAADPTKNIDFVQRARDAKDLLNFWRDPFPNYTNLTSSCVKEAGAKGSGQRPTYPCSNFHFHFNLLNVTVGTPPQAATVVLSSGRDDTWVFGPDFFYRTPNQKLFDSKKSTTFTSYDYPLPGNSGELSVDSENTCHDMLTLGGASFKQILGVVDDGDSWADYMQLQIDGNVGLSWSDALTEQASSASKHLLKYYNVTNGLFTVWLGKSPTPGSDGLGQITLGNYNTQRCGPVLATIPHTSRWTPRNVALERFTFDSYSTRGTTAYFDTGFPVLAFPQKIYQAIDRLINPIYNWDYGLYTVECAKSETLKPWIFQFQGQAFSVPAKDYLLDINLPNGQCVLAFSQMGYQYVGDYALGSPFIRNFCTTYSINDNEVRLSKAL